MAIDADPTNANRCRSMPVMVNQCQLMANLCRAVQSSPVGGMDWAGLVQPSPSYSTSGSARPSQTSP
eukprot:9723691-Lingulodinium_polyedra.AAC.1